MISSTDEEKAEWIAFLFDTNGVSLKDISREMRDKYKKCLPKTLARWGVILKSDDVCELRHNDVSKLEVTKTQDSSARPF
jgi:hypothetical protein